MFASFPSPSRTAMRCPASAGPSASDFVRSLAAGRLRLPRTVPGSPCETGFAGQATSSRASPWRRSPAKRRTSLFASFPSPSRTAMRCPASAGPSASDFVRSLAAGRLRLPRTVPGSPCETGFAGQATSSRASPWRRSPAKRRSMNHTITNHFEGGGASAAAPSFMKERRPIHAQQSNRPHQ